MYPNFLFCRFEKKKSFRKKKLIGPPSQGRTLSPGSRLRASLPPLLFHLSLPQSPFLLCYSHPRSPVMIRGKECVSINVLHGCVYAKVRNGFNRICIDILVGNASQPTDTCIHKGDIYPYSYRSLIHPSLPTYISTAKSTHKDNHYAHLHACKKSYIHKTFISK